MIWRSLSLYRSETAHESKSRSIRPSLSIGLLTSSLDLGIIASVIDWEWTWMCSGWDRFSAATQGNTSASFVFLLSLMGSLVGLMIFMGRHRSLHIGVTVLPTKTFLGFHLAWVGSTITVLPTDIGAEQEACPTQDVQFDIVSHSVAMPILLDNCLYGSATQYHVISLSMHPNMGTTILQSYTSISTSYAAEGMTWWCR